MEVIVPKTNEKLTSLSVVREESKIVELSKDRKAKKRKNEENAAPGYLMPEQPKGYLKCRDFDHL